MRSPRAANEVDEFVIALLETTGQLSQIADHMASVQAAGVSSPEALPPAEVIRNLLTETIANAKPGFTKADVRKAAGVLRRTARTIEREIYLVPIDEIERDG